MSDNLDFSIFDIVGPVMLGPSSSGKSQEEIVSRMRDMWRIIKRSVSEGSRGTYRPIMGLDDGKNGQRVLEAIRKGQTVSGTVSAKAAAYALSVMEYAVSMGCIVAAPTCGSAGVAPRCSCGIAGRIRFFG